MIIHKVHFHNEIRKLPENIRKCFLKLLADFPRDSKMSLSQPV